MVADVIDIGLVRANREGPLIAGTGSAFSAAREVDY
jgi:hypothetical protein